VPPGGTACDRRGIPAAAAPGETAPRQPGHAVWLLPTPRFRRAALANRAALWQIAGKTSDPEKALRNLLERDRMFTELLAEETKRLELPAVEIDTTMTEENLADRVTKILGL